MKGELKAESQAKERTGYREDILEPNREGQGTADISISSQPYEDTGQHGRSAL